jgi:hypothetical protein
MTCCGKKRKAAVPSHSSSARQANNAAAQARMARLHYLGSRPVTAVGPATGRTYDFDLINRTRPVELADVAGMVRTKLFRVV